MADSMDEAHRKDYAVERECRDLARRLTVLARGHRFAGTTRETECIALAAALTDEADHIVRVWD